MLLIFAFVFASVVDIVVLRPITAIAILVLSVDRLAGLTVLLQYVWPWPFAYRPYVEEIALLAVVRNEIFRRRTLSNVCVVANAILWSSVKLLWIFKPNGCVKKGIKM